MQSAVNLFWPPYFVQFEGFAGGVCSRCGPRFRPLALGTQRRWIARLRKRPERVLLGPARDEILGRSADIEPFRRELWSDCLPAVAFWPNAFHGHGIGDDGSTVIPAKRHENRARDFKAGQVLLALSGHDADIAVDGQAPDREGWTAIDGNPGDACLFCRLIHEGVCHATILSSVRMQARWDALTIAAVTVGIVAVSSSGALIAFAAAPALAIAFWRNALATAVLAPVTVTSRRSELGSPAIKTSVLAGLALAVHFGTWVPSVKLTSIATATALVCTQPVWGGLIMAIRGDRLSKGTWAGMALAITGAIIATGADLQTGGTAILGDLLAICAAIAGAIYTMIGQRVRAQLSTTTYTTVCYGVCAVSLLVVCLAAGTQLTGFPNTAWLAILGLTAGAQLLGHSMLNYALQKIPAVTINVIVLLEVPGAILLGWAWLHQAVTAITLLGIAVLLSGIGLVVVNPGGRSGLRPQPASDL